MQGEREGGRKCCSKPPSFLQAQKQKYGTLRTVKPWLCSCVAALLLGTRGGQTNTLSSPVYKKSPNTEYRILTAILVYYNQYDVIRAGPNRVR